MDIASHVVGHENWLSEEYIDGINWFFHVDTDSQKL